MKTKQEQLLLPSTSAVLSIGWWQRACYLSLFLSMTPTLIATVKSRMYKHTHKLLLSSIIFRARVWISSTHHRSLQLLFEIVPFGILTSNTLPQSFVAYYFGAYIDSFGKLQRKPASICSSGDLICRMYDWMVSNLQVWRFDQQDALLNCFTIYSLLL